MAWSVAVAGKGGTGKTTLAALLVRALREAGVRPVLAVDADPNSSLAEALGVEPGTPLARIREAGARPEGSPEGGIGRGRAIEDEIQRAVVEAEGFDLVTMGRGEGPRCYCYVNTLLRQALDGLAKNYAAVVVDNEAGMEHLSRRTTNDVDVLLVVTDATRPAVRAAGRIAELSRELPVRIARRAVVVNRVPAAGVGRDLEEVLSGLGLERLPDVPQDDAVERRGAEGKDVFGLEAGVPALAAVRRLLDVLQAVPAAAARCRKGGV